jgi:hypothetical protein
MRTKEARVTGRALTILTMFGPVSSGGIVPEWAAVPSVPGGIIVSTLGEALCAPVSNNRYL